MKNHKILTLLFLISFVVLSCRSKKEIQTDNYTFIDSTGTISAQLINQQRTTLSNQIKNPNIKTVLCHKKGDELTLAMINLSSEEKITISFDELNSERKNYIFTITHCNSDWKSSNLMKSEYIEGFTEEYISNYEFSFNTLQKYIHYQFDFPTINMKPILSGNYIFKIYEENGDTIIYKRFMVLNKRLHVQANVRRATLAEDRYTKHEIDFTIKHPNLIIADPFADIKVHIKQNNREDNAITGLTPKFVRNDELSYDYDEGNTFWGNNEFRDFDIRSLRYQSKRIKNIDSDSTYNHIYLFNDKKRPFDRYSIFEIDINGNFIIESQEGWKSSIESDYAFVHFSLPVDNISYGDLYLLGAFSDWELKEEFRLKYNIDQKKYQKNVYLKQGYYNYHYALNDTISNQVDVSFIEGTHYQTRNDYYIYVYHRAVGDRYDQLVGFLKTSSKELF